jgi:predicted small lipoprotein YifL
MKRLILLIAAIFCSALFGCGQSGPLYLPGDPSQIREAPQPVQDADEKRDADEGDER